MYYSAPMVFDLKSFLDNTFNSDNHESSIGNSILDFVIYLTIY